MQVGEEDLVTPHAVVLLGDGFLHLEDEVAGLPDIIGCRQHACAGGDVLLIADGRADAGTGLDEDLMTMAHELEHASRGNRDAVLVVLHFLGDADLHSVRLRTSVAGRGPRA